MGKNVVSIMDLGALGEFIGAIAVVATGYLTLQVRLSAKSTKSNAIAQAASDHLANMRSLAENPALASAFEKTQRGETVGSPESTQIAWWFVCFLRGAETHVQMAKLGIVPEFEAPWEDILRRMSRGDETLRIIIENYVGSKTFRKWLDDKILSRLKKPGTR